MGELLKINEGRTDKGLVVSFYLLILHVFVSVDIRVGVNCLA